jgi:hypothetical protein
MVGRVHPSCVNFREALGRLPRQSEGTANLGSRCNFTASRCAGVFDQVDSEKTKEVSASMKMKPVTFVLGLAVVLAMAVCPTFARSTSPQGSSKEKSFHVQLDAAKLSNGTLLKAGDYILKITENTPSPEIEFYRNGKLVAKTQAKVVTQPRKNDYTAVETSPKGKAKVITAIYPDGWPERLVLTNSPARTGA